MRFPDSDTAPDPEQFLLTAEEASDLVLRQLGSTALFAAKFRESAARALLLPRRRAQGRAPLWQQRKRAYDLLSVASRYPSFPMLLEAYRECMRDVLDMPALQEILRAIAARQVRVHVVDSRTPSPFASRQRTMTHADTVRVFTTMPATPRTEITATLPADAESVRAHAVVLLTDRDARIVAARRFDTR